MERIPSKELVLEKSKRSYLHFISVPKPRLKKLWDWIAIAYRAESEEQVNGINRSRQRQKNSFLKKSDKGGGVDGTSVKETRFEKNLKWNIGKYRNVKKTRFKKY